MQFAETGIPALLHKRNVHRKIFLQQILNLAKGILPTPAFAFDEGRKTTALINHKSEFLVQYFKCCVFNILTGLYSTASQKKFCCRFSDTESDAFSISDLLIPNSRFLPFSHS